MNKPQNYSLAEIYARFACPKCGVAAGERCKKFVGNRIEQKQWMHRERWRVAKIEFAKESS